MKQEKCLWEILKEDYGFKPHVHDVPSNSYQEFRELWVPGFWLKLFPVKTVKKSSDEWMSVTINGNFYEIAMIDIWYVNLRKNDIEIFDARRFDNEEFLKLLV